MAYQGDLDGLCGPYAIVNAFDRCDLDEEWLGEDLFKIACSTIDNWPDTLWDGTNFEQMMTMVDRCMEVLQQAFEYAKGPFDLEVDYPFYDNDPGSSSNYWNAFDEIFSHDNVLCGIAGMEHPAKHWFAFVRKRKTLEVFDSGFDGEIRRMKINDIHAGRNRMAKYVVNREELIVFFRND